jgi:hypothetical protein
MGVPIVAVAPSAESLDALEQIERHLSVHGSQAWGPLRERLAVSDATFWRLVRVVKEKAPAPEILDHARAQLAGDDDSRSPDENLATIAANLPAVPSPNFIAKNGADGRAKLDILAKFGELYADAEKLKTYSLTADGKTIRTPAFWAQSISLRRDLLVDQIKTMAIVYDMEVMLEYVGTIMQEIEAESPACVERITDRLARLNNVHGMRMRDAGS